MNSLQSDKLDEDEIESLSIDDSHADQGMYSLTEAQNRGVWGRDIPNNFKVGFQLPVG